MNDPRSNAVVYCEGAFGSTYGKTAHGIVRFSRRYNVISVIDSQLAGRDAGIVLDGEDRDIPILSSLDEVSRVSRRRGLEPTHFVVGLAPDGGRLDRAGREEIKNAIEAGLNVASGLHDFISEDPVLGPLAAARGVEIRDVRKPPEKSALHFFTGDIEEVTAFKIAVLGTDSAVGKRTTAWKLVEGFEAAGIKAEMIGTGQTAWFQGARYGVVMDALVNDFVTGEIEHAVVSAWREQKPDVVVVEGQGSLLNPAYPGGFEILAAARPDAILLQHAPARREYDGFPGYPIHPLPRQIEALEVVSDAKVLAIAINHEGISQEDLPRVNKTIEHTIGMPAVDVLVEGAARLVEVFKGQIAAHPKRSRTGR